MLLDFEKRFAIGLISRNRSICASNNRQYGGVSRKTLQPFPLNNPREYEIVAASGNVIKGKLFIVACYAPPNITPTRADELLEFLSDVIAEGKRKFPNCSVVVGGDFNQWQAEGLLQEHLELAEVKIGP